MYTEPRTATITDKYSYKGPQPLNGKMMFMDFPVRRPIYYVLALSNGDEVEVSQAEYRSYSVGDTLTYDHQVWEPLDYVIAGLIVVLVLGIIALLFGTV